MNNVNWNLYGLEYSDQSAGSRPIVCRVPLRCSSPLIRRIYLGADGLCLSTPPWKVWNSFAFLFFQGPPLRARDIDGLAILAEDPGWWDGPPEILPPLPNLDESPPRALIPEPPTILDALRSDPGLAEILARKVGAKRSGRCWRVKLTHTTAVLQGVKKDLTRSRHYFAREFFSGAWWSLDAVAFAAAHGRLPEKNKPEEKREAFHLLLAAAHESGALLRLTREAIKENEGILRALSSAVPPFTPFLEGGSVNKLPASGGDVRSLFKTPPPEEGKSVSCEGGWNAVWAVWEALTSLFMDAARDGHPSASGSVRFVAQRAGVRPSEACRGLNFLTVLGVIEKVAKGVRPGDPKSLPERFVLRLPSYEAALTRWASLAFVPPRRLNRAWLEAHWPPEKVATVIRTRCPKRAAPGAEGDEEVCF